MKFIYATYNQYCNSRNKAGLFYLTGTITFVDGRFQIKLIPAHIRHVFWKQILKEDFLDAIYDCLFEMHELVTDEDISKAILALKDVQKELLYQFAIKRYYYQLIAAFR